MRTVLVTGVGALIGQGIIQALNKSVDRQDIHVIGIDRNKETHARHLCDQFIQKPCVEESSVEYLDFWCSLIREHRIELILPGIEDDVIFFNQHRQSSVSLPALLNSSKTLALGLDKYALFEFADANNTLIIPTALASDSQAIEKLDLIEKKTIVKPRSSNGSRGIFRFEGDGKIKSFLEKRSIEELGYYIVQPYIGTDTEEYTASIFGFGDGTYQGPIAFKRLLAKEGYTKYARTVEPTDGMLLSIDTVAKSCHPVGPTNFQFRKQDERYFLMEINPRFSSTTSVKTAFGFDETQMAIRYFFNGEKDFDLSMLHGEAWRHTCDFVKYA
jgi:carbamoyl-phosphate synthase large subunit